MLCKGHLADHVELEKEVFVAQLGKITKLQNLEQEIPFCRFF